MREFAEDNENNTYILTVTDVLSKYTLVKGLKTKTGVKTGNDFDKIFGDGRIPEINST